MRIPLRAGILAAILGCVGSLLAANPPATWQEHWFDHNQVVNRVYFDDDIAIYFDDGFTPAEREAALAWMVPYAGRLWRYTIEKYGTFGSEGRLYGIFHDGRYSGGHPSTYLDASHDFRNVADCGPGPWTSPTYDLFTHEVGHIVEIANNNVLDSPAFGIWGDSKWAEIYIYDAYIGLGMTAEAQRVYDQWIQGVDDFPRAGTRWFRDWYYPIWRDHGRTRVLVRFFDLLAAHFPKVTANNGGGPIEKYARALNWGEYVYFMGAAARTDLRDRAKAAFGWSDEWDAQYLAASGEFPSIDPTQDFPTNFGRKIKARRVASRYRLVVRIRDENGIKRVVVQAGRKKATARAKGNLYSFETKKKPKSVKVRVMDNLGNKANKRYLVR